MCVASKLFPVLHLPFRATGSFYTRLDASGWGLGRLVPVKTWHGTKGCQLRLGAGVFAKRVKPCMHCLLQLA